LHVSSLCLLISAVAAQRRDFLKTLDIQRFSKAARKADRRRATSRPWRDVS
jgi:hypothetical protein